MASSKELKGLYQVVYILSCGRVDQPAGVFTTKLNALRYVKEKRIWGKVYRYRTDIALIDQVVQAGYSIGKSKDPNDPITISEFSTAFVEAASVFWEGNKILVIDRELQIKDELDNYFKSVEKGGNT